LGHENKTKIEEKPKEEKKKNKRHYPRLSLCLIMRHCYPAEERRQFVN
jgi:hypothetical protein